MAEFTKEEQVQAIYDLKVGYTLGYADIAMLKSMARQLLASMEQEPIYQVQHGDQWRDLNKAQYDDHVNLGADGLRILYAAPQLPQPAVVPDKMTAIVPSEHEFVEGWNACRAAMLQGAEPVREWIPCSERMPEIEGHYLVWANASNLDGYCDHQAMATYQGGEWSNEFNWLVTHWMPLPAAPQQELNK